MKKYNFFKVLRQSSLPWKGTTSLRCWDNHPRINKIPWKSTTSLRCWDNHPRINKLPWKNTTSLRCWDNHPRINKLPRKNTTSPRCWDNHPRINNLGSELSNAKQAIFPLWSWLEQVTFDEMMICPLCTRSPCLVGFL